MLPLAIQCNTNNHFQYRNCNQTTGIPAFESQSLTSFSTSAGETGVLVSGSHFVVIDK
jgi:hypothetical protein